MLPPERLGRARQGSSCSTTSSRYMQWHASRVQSRMIGRVDPMDDMPLKSRVISYRVKESSRLRYEMKQSAGGSESEPYVDRSAPIANRDFAHPAYSNYSYRTVSLLPAQAYERKRDLVLTVNAFLMRQTRLLRLGSDILSVSCRKRCRRQWHVLA